MKDFHLSILFATDPVQNATVNVSFCSFSFNKGGPMHGLSFCNPLRSQMLWNYIIVRRKQPSIHNPNLKVVLLGKGLDNPAFESSLLRAGSTIRFRYNCIQIPYCPFFLSLFKANSQIILR